MARFYCNAPPASPGWSLRARRAVRSTALTMQPVFTDTPWRLKIMVMFWQISRSMLGGVHRYARRLKPMVVSI